MSSGENCAITCIVIVRVICGTCQRRQISPLPKFKFIRCHSLLLTWTKNVERLRSNWLLQKLQLETLVWTFSLLPASGGCCIGVQFFPRHAEAAFKNKFCMSCSRNKLSSGKPFFHSRVPRTLILCSAFFVAPHLTLLALMGYLAGVAGFCAAYRVLTK